MKVAAIKAYVLSADLKTPFAYSQGWYDKRMALVVEVVTDEGLSGFGEVYGPPRPNRGVVEAYAPLLIGEDPFAIERHRHRALGPQGEGARAAGARPHGRADPRPRARLRHRPLPPRPPRPRDLSARGGRLLCGRRPLGDEAQDRLGRRRGYPPDARAARRDRP